MKQESRGLPVIPSIHLRGKMRMTHWGTLRHGLVRTVLRMPHLYGVLTGTALTAGESAQ